MRGFDPGLFRPALPARAGFGLAPGRSNRLDVSELLFLMVLFADPLQACGRKQCCGDAQ